MVRSKWKCEKLPKKQLLLMNDSVCILSSPFFKIISLSLSFRKYCSNLKKRATPKHCKFSARKNKKDWRLPSWWKLEKESKSLSNFIFCMMTSKERKKPKEMLYLESFEHTRNELSLNENWIENFWEEYESQIMLFAWLNSCKDF